MQQVSGKLRRGNEPHEPSEGKQRAPWSLAFPFPTFPSTDRHANLKAGYCTACLTGEYPGGLPEELSW